VRFVQLWFTDVLGRHKAFHVTPNMIWSHPNDVAGRAEIQWAVALRMLNYMSNDTELVSRSRAAARVTEKKFQIVWPYYREDFHFIY
jgi:hypothetical protein